MLPECRNLKILTCIILIGTISSLAQAGVNDLDRGHRLLIEKGLQLQAGILDFQWNTNAITLPTYRDPLDEAGFTTMHFGNADWAPNALGGNHMTENTHPSHTYETETMPWARWSFGRGIAEVTYYANRTMVATASDYDELDLTVPANVTLYTTYLTDMRSIYPNIISHTTQAKAKHRHKDLPASLAHRGFSSSCQSSERLRGPQRDALLPPRPPPDR